MTPTSKFGTIILPSRSSKSERRPSKSVTIVTLSLASARCCLDPRYAAVLPFQHAEALKYQAPNKSAQRNAAKPQGVNLMQNTHRTRAANEVRSSFIQITFQAEAFHQDEDMSLELTNVSIPDTSSDQSNRVYSSQTTTLCPSGRVCISILNVHCSHTDMAPTEKSNRVAPELERMTPKHKSQTGDPYLESEADSEADSEANSEADSEVDVRPKKVDKGKGKAIYLPNGRNEEPAPKVCYDLMAQ